MFPFAKECKPTDCLALIPIYFVCFEEKLVIEVDGGYHCQPAQELLDEKRTERLNDMGFTVIRFDNETIIEKIDDVIKVICRYIF